MSNEITTNSEMNNAFYAWIHFVSVTEAKRDRGELRDKHTGEQIDKRYANENFACPTRKQIPYLLQCMQYLEPALQDWLEMVIEGDMLYADQIFGNDVYEGVGLMDLRFGMSRDLFVSDALANKKRQKRMIMDELAKRANL